MSLLTPEIVFRNYETAGVPDSGAHDPKKSEIIQLLNRLFGVSRGGWVVARTLAELTAITPENETDGGVVLTGAGSGYYDRDSSAWVFGRGFPDTFAKVALSGSGTVQYGAINAGVNPASIEVFFANVVTPNTGPLTLAVDGGPALDVINLAGNPLSAGEWTGMVMFYLNDVDQYQLLIDAGAAAAAAAAASAAAASAASAEEDADRAEAAASSIDLPDPVASTMLVRDADNFAYEVLAALEVRLFLGIGTARSYFDYVPRNLREGIADGTDTTTDQAPYWSAFHAALEADRAAGKAPYGIIPQCTIYTSVSPNFAMDYLRLETHGTVRAIGTGSNFGISFDGTNLGVGGYGIRHMVIDPIEASSTTGAVGYNVAWCHKSIFRRAISRGASFAGIRTVSCVTSYFDTPTVSPQATPWIQQPTVPIYISSTPGVGGYNMPCSWTTLLNPIGEYGTDACIQMDNTFGMVLIAGTAEGGLASGLGRGLVMGADTHYAKIYGLDCEANDGDDILCLGSNNQFFGVDTMLMFRFIGAGAWGNKVYGGKHWVISLDTDTKSNLIDGATAYSIVDSSVSPNRNRVVNCIKLDGSANLEGWVDAWKAYAPTVAAATGTLTTKSAAGQYKEDADGTVHISVVLTITTNGTGAGAIKFTLPLTAGFSASFHGTENGISARGVTCTVGGSGATEATCWFSSDGLYPGGNGRVLTISGTYRKQ